MNKIKLSNLMVLLPVLLLGWGSAAADLRGEVKEHVRLVVGKTPVTVTPTRWSTTQAPNFEFRVAAIPSPMFSWLNDQLKGATTLGTGSIHFCAVEPEGIWDYAGGLIEKVRSPELKASSSSKAYFEFALRLPKVTQRMRACEGVSSKSVALISKNFSTETDISSGLSRIFRVSPFTISFPQAPTTPSKTRDRSQIPAVAKPVFSSITFGASGNKDEVKSVFEIFQKTAFGNPLPGTITVSLMNSQYETVLVFEFRDLAIMSYSPVGSLNVDDPTTLVFEFTVLPGDVKISN